LASNPDIDESLRSLLRQCHQQEARSGRGFDENVKVDIPGQMTEHPRTFLFTCIFNDLQ
jgi:hypothetical protein